MANRSDKNQKSRSLSEIFTGRGPNRAITNTPVTRMKRAALREIDERQRSHPIQGTDELDRREGTPWGRHKAGGRTRSNATKRAPSGVSDLESRSPARERADEPEKSVVYHLPARLVKRPSSRRSHQQVLGRKPRPPRSRRQGATTKKAA